MVAAQEDVDIDVDVDEGVDTGIEVEIDVPDGWTVIEGGKKMAIEVETKDFLQAMDIMNELADVAEELQHHPDLHLEQWNQLRVVSWSHDIGGLSDRDEKLAARVTGVLDKRGLLD